MRSRDRHAAGALVLLGAAVLAGCGSGSAGSQPETKAATTPAAVRTLYVDAPLSGPAADEGRAMVDAARLIVDQAGGIAGRVRVIVRALDDGGVASATDPRRCAANARRAAADPSALAVIGTYELSCSKRALAILRPAGLWLVSPVNAAGSLPGALRLAPTLRDQGRAAAQFAHALGATRIAIVSEHRGAAPAFANGLTAVAPVVDGGPVAQLDASATPTEKLVTELEAGRVQLVALAGSPGGWANDLLRALAQLPQATRPAVIAPQDFDTLAFLAAAGPAAEGVRVISRLVPVERLGGARGFASAYADLHGEPPPVAAYAADAAQTVLTAAAVAGGSRAAMSTALAAPPAHDGLLGHWAGTRHGGITPRQLAVLVVDSGAFRVERVVSVADPLPASGDVK